MVLSYQRLTDIGVATQAPMEGGRTALLIADDDEIRRLPRIGIFNSAGAVPCGYGEP